MQKKRMAFVLDSMVVGGVERALLEVLKNIDYQRYEVVLFLGDDQGQLQSCIPDQVSVAFFSVQDTKALLKKQIRNGDWISAGKGVVNRLKARKYANNYNLNAHFSTKGLPLCSTEEFDCVIGYQILSPTVVATALYRIKGKKKVLFVHGRNVRPPELIHFYDKVYNCFDRIYCVSQKTRSDFATLFPTAALKTDVMYNLLDIERITGLADETAEIHADINTWKLATVGRLESVKGQDMIPEATRILRDQGYKLKWYIIGDGGYREEVEQKIDQNGARDSVVMMGTLLNPYPYLKACDIYVQPSRSEGYCTTTMEAKILHKPIVTTDAPGMREQFVSGENGLIVDAMTPEAIADGIRQLMDHPELMDQFTNALKNETFDNSKELQKLYDFIES